MIRRCMWFFVGVFLVSAPMFAFADYYYPAQGAVTYSILGISRSTPGEACSATGSGTRTTAGAQYNGCYLNGTSFVGSIAASGGTCSPAPAGLTVVGFVTYSTTHPPTAIPGNGAYCRYTGTPTCPEGQQFVESTGQCQVPPPPPCTAGTEHSSGYYDYGTQYDGRMVAYGCADGCEVTFSGSFGGRQIIGGVYHYFMQGSYNETGGTCTSGPTVPTSAPSKPPISCGTNQSYGQINGQDVCIDKSTGTTSNPYAPKPTETETGETTTTQNPDGTTTTTTTKTDSSGRTTTTTKTCDQAGNCTEETTSSGGTGGSGDGAGDTPGDPGTGTEGDPMDKENDQCKLTPNAVMCQEKVKVDEEGVPTDADTKGMTAQKNQLDEKANELKAQLEGRSWERSDLGFSWNPGFPAGSCSSIEIANQSIDVCTPLGYVRDIWNYVCVFLAALAIWIRGTGALRGA